MFGSQEFQHLGHLVLPVSGKHTNDLALCPGGIRHRAKHIHECANADFLSNRSRKAHGRVVGLSKHKADTNLVDAGGNLLRRQGERNSSSFQHIGAAAETGHLSIAMLGNLGTGACRNEGRCG